MSERAVIDLTTAGGGAAVALGVGFDWIDLLSQGYSATMAALALLLAIGRVALMVREWRQGRRARG
jgi:hypothetical protein